MSKLVKLTLAAFIAGGVLPVHSGHATEADTTKNITVFKTPWCGCCQVWVDAIEKAGYTVTTKDMDDLSLIKKQGGVPKAMEACHTAVLEGERKYVLEGHVPLQAIEKLIAERPDIRGIATPGMPMGSLGMGYDDKARYTVYAYGGKKGKEPFAFYEAGSK